MFKNIKFYNFRNLENKQFNTANRHVILQGSNGKGKTNFLEAVYFLCFGSSFRERKDEHIAVFGAKEFAVIGRHADCEEETDKISASWREGLKQIKINGAAIKDRKELVRQFPCIAFVHEDLKLSEGDQDIRRRFFDQIISLCDISFIDSLRHYKRVLKQRNKALKLQQANLLPDLNRQLAVAGLPICQKRTQMLDEFQAVFSRMLNNTAQFNINIHYNFTWKGSQLKEIESFLFEKQGSDLRSGYSNFGPHRDRYSFLWDQKEAAFYLSTGEKRLLSLILKAAGAQIYAKHKKKDPILLLDDVLLELDTEVRKAFIATLPQYRQIFFAFLPHEPLLGQFSDAVTLNLDENELG